VIAQADPSCRDQRLFRRNSSAAGYAIILDNPDPQFPNAPPRPLVISSPTSNRIR